MTEEHRIRIDERKKIIAQGCIHTRKAAEQDGNGDRADIVQWQSDQGEWFDPTICGIVSEYAAWRDKQPMPKPFHQWHEDIGPVLWWLWPIEQEPYVGSPLDLGFIVEADVDLAASCGAATEGKLKMNVGGWPWRDADDETVSCLFWTPLPNCDGIDEAIRDYIRGGPDPMKEPHP